MVAISLKCLLRLFPLFLNKLPRELWLLLSEVDTNDKQSIGARVDYFAAHNSKQCCQVAVATAK
jgi:hypothetical protein